MPTRPVLRYHGGKWRLAPWIISHFPPHSTYVEPYGGAASVLMRKPRAANEIYNDLDGDVVNVFRVLRDSPSAQALCSSLALTPFARSEFECAYEPADDPIERARRTIIRSFMGFGSASFNSAHATGFRVYTSATKQRRPHQDWTNYPEQVAAFVSRIQGVIIESRPALDVILRHQSADTLFYVDPPYPLDTRGSATGVRQKYQHEMTIAEHVALADALHSIEGPVVVSGYPCPLYDLDLYAGWARHEMAAMADGANPRTEVLWLNPACVQAMDNSRAHRKMFA